MGRPSSRRLQAQLHAIQSQAWVPYLMESYQGVRNTTKRPKPPRFTSHDVVTHPGLKSTSSDQHDWSKNADIFREGEVYESLEPKMIRLPSISMHQVQGSKVSETFPSEIKPQAAAAWLVAWSICRVLAHVQILPAFLGSHVSDTECWLN